MVLEDPRGQGLSSRTTTLGLDAPDDDDVDDDDVRLLIQVRISA